MAIARTDYPVVLETRQKSQGSIGDVTYLLSQIWRQPCGQFGIECDLNALNELAKANVTCWLSAV